MALNEFEDRIKAYIKQDGRSQAAVARKLDYAPDTFNKWVKGTNRIPDSVIYALCKLFGLDDSQRAELLVLAGYTIPPVITQEPSIDLKQKRRAPIAVAPLQRPPRPDEFVGREVEVKQILENLKPGCVITLCGPGGIGKTTLAAEVIWQLAPDNIPPKQFPDGVIFHCFFGQPQVELALEKIARCFGEDLQPTASEAARRALAGRNILLILDGAEDADNLTAILDIRDRCGVIVTSRKRSDAISERQDLTPLSLDIAVALLQKLAGKRANNETAVRKICTQIGNLPLAVRLVGRYLVQQEWDATEYLEWLKVTPLSALEQDQRELKSVNTLLNGSVTQLSDLARQALSVIGLLALTPFDHEIIVQALELPSNIEARQALGDLINFGLVQRNDQQYETSHALIHTYAREQLLPSLQIIQNTANYLISITKNNQDHFSQLEPLRSHVLALMGKCIVIEEWPLIDSLASAFWEYLELQGYWVELIDILEAGLKSARGLQNYVDEGRWLDRLGCIYCKKGQYEAAIKLHEQALTIFQSTDNREYEGTVLSNLGVAHSQWGNHQVAIDYQKRALDSARSVNNIDTELLVLNNLGIAHLYQGNYKTAIEYCREGLVTAKKIGVRSPEGTITGNMGMAYLAIGENQTAIEHFEQALLISRETGNRQGEGVILANLGIAYCRIEQYDKAIGYQEQALPILQEIGDRRNEAIALTGLGLGHNGLKDYDKAIIFFEQALQIAQEIGDRHNSGGYLAELGKTYHSLKKYQTAITYFDQALEISRQLGERNREGRLLGYLGETYLELSTLEVASQYFQEALKITFETDDHYNSSRWLGGLSRVHLNLNQNTKSIAYAEQGLQIARDNKHTSNIASRLYELGAAYKALGDRKLAQQYWKQSLDLFENIDRAKSDEIHSLLNELKPNRESAV